MELTTVVISKMKLFSKASMSIIGLWFFTNHIGHVLGGKSLVLDEPTNSGPSMPYVCSLRFHCVLFPLDLVMLSLIKLN